MRQAAVHLVRRLQEAGFQAFWVGGCVRDLLLGIEPNDYDIATSARPEEIQSLFERTREVGRSFGVTQVEVEGYWIQVATFRTDGEYRDARHPESVAFTDAQQDARRRDFTLNALYMDPLSGTILDDVGGQADLEARRLRAVGDPHQRFHEDALRLLRAIRFACRFGLEIESATADALKANAVRIRMVAGERVRDELLAILTGPDRRRGLTLLRETGLLQEILPELVPLKGCEQSPRHHPEGDVWEHTLRMLDLLQSPDEEIALGAVLHDIGKPETRRLEDGEVHFYGHEVRGQAIAKEVMQRLRIPGHTQDVVQMLIGQHMRFIEAPNMRQSTLRRFLLQESFAKLLELHRLDALSARGDLTTYEFCRQELEKLEREAPPIRPLLSGHELIALGFEPGPRLGQILRGLVDAQLDGTVQDRQAATAWVAKHFGAPHAGRGNDESGSSEGGEQCDEGPGGSDAGT